MFKMFYLPAKVVILAKKQNTGYRKGNFFDRKAKKVFVR